MTENAKEAVIRKIRALMAKTQSAGCSEAEATAAAEKISELMEEYELSRDDINDVKEERWGKRGKKFAGGSRRRNTWHVSINCHQAIAAFTSTRVWYSGDHLVFFGTEIDTELAHYLADLVKNAVEAEAVRFMRGEGKGGGWDAGRSFRQGMTHRIRERLLLLVAARRSNLNSTATGNALVVVKDAELQRRYEVATSHIKWGKGIGRGMSNGSNGNAYGAGRAAGDRVNLNTGVGAGGSAKAIGR